VRLTLEGDRYQIEDLNSTNGTYIDGQRLIGPHIMAIGEIIMFGDNVGVIFEGEPALPDITVISTVDLGSTPVAAIPAPEESPVQLVTPMQPKLNEYPIAEESIPDIEPETPEETAKKPINTWLLAGCGCLVVIVLLFIAVLVFIDQYEGGLYCRTPFDIIFGTLGFCP
jgi:pSer/pThr/pTyr-binding forkhead associated (FHA) protein